MSWKPLERTVPHRNGVPIDIEGEIQYANDLYVCTVRDLHPNHEDTPPAKHISIRRQDREPCRDWRDFQRIKNQLAGPEWTAVEIYPAESVKVDGANQYHLFAFDVPHLGFGFTRRIVANQAQINMVTPGAVQRDPEPVDLMYGGLTKLKDIMNDNPPYQEKEGIE